MIIATRLPTPVRQHLAALRVLLVLTVIVGIVYPLAITGIAQLILPGQANGSLVHYAGRPVGSSLLGQPFVDAQGNPLPQWFQPRPSAAAGPSSSAASNLGPTNTDLIKKINDRRAATAAFDGVAPGDVAPDAVTASASGLDPDISPAYADEQVNRVAHARGLDPAAVQALVTDHIQHRILGILGEPRVNVVELNLALGGAR
ncbi:MAG: potassium-transporting ATPase subunit KdpC [Pseudonocardiaceae bacterium]